MEKISSVVSPYDNSTYIVERDLSLDSIQPVYGSINAGSGQLIRTIFPISSNIDTLLFEFRTTSDTNLPIFTYSEEDILTGQVVYPDGKISEIRTTYVVVEPSWGYFTFRGENIPKIKIEKSRLRLLNPQLTAIDYQQNIMASDDACWSQNTAEGVLVTSYSNPANTIKCTYSGYPVYLFFEHLLKENSGDLQNIFINSAILNLFVESVFGVGDRNIDFYTTHTDWRSYMGSTTHPPATFVKTVGETTGSGIWNHFDITDVFLKEVTKEKIHTGYQIETNLQYTFRSVEWPDPAYHPNIVVSGKKIVFR